MQYGTERLSYYTEDIKKSRGGLDLPFLFLVLILLACGVIMVLSASYARAYYSSETGNNALYYFARQLIFALVGVVMMLMVSKIPMEFFRRHSFTFLAISILALAAVPIIGVSANGAKRWISLGFTTFQPSEIVKVAIVLHFANMICAFGSRMRTVKYGIIPFAGILLVIIALLALEPHFSAAIIILAIAAGMLFLGGVRLYWFIAVGSVAVLGLGLLMTFFPYAITRISTWLDPFSDMTGSGYQIVQSLYSIGSGGLLGKGLGQSLQKYSYLPEEHNDYIFAVWCEEMGFIGSIAILILFSLLILRGYWLAMHMSDRYSFLVTAGLTTALAMQVILNVAVVTNLVPSTGISLAFFSYGGTALLIQLVEMGIILSATRDIKVSGYS